MKFFAIYKDHEVRKNLSFMSLKELREKIKKDDFLSLDDFYLFDKLFGFLCSTPAYEVSMKIDFANYQIVIK